MVVANYKALFPSFLPDNIIHNQGFFSQHTYQQTNDAYQKLVKIPQLLVLLHFNIQAQTKKESTDKYVFRRGKVIYTLHLVS
jgi:hypothetical protein